jgi:hypothetical protein
MTLPGSGSAGTAGTDGTAGTETVGTGGSVGGFAFEGFVAPGEARWTEVPERELADEDDFAAGETPLFDPARVLAAGGEAALLLAAAAFGADALVAAAEEAAAAGGTEPPWRPTADELALAEDAPAEFAAAVGPVEVDVVVLRLTVVPEMTVRARAAEEALPCEASALCVPRSIATPPPTATTSAAVPAASPPPPVTPTNPRNQETSGRSGRIEPIARRDFLAESDSACARWRRPRKICVSTAEWDTPRASAISV